MRYCFTVLLLLASVLGLVSVPGLHSQWSLESVHLEHKGRLSRLADLPVQRDLVGEYKVHVTLRSPGRNALALRIIPDDRLVSLSVNGATHSLENYDPVALKNWREGLVLHLRDLHPDRSNQLIFGLSNRSNPAGFAIEPVYSPWQYALGAASLLLLAWALGRHLPITGAQRALLLTGLGASLLYLSATTPDTRTFDVYEGGGHRDYIHYLAEHQRLPLASAGWEYHQPPLYYAVAAALYHWLDKPAEDDRWAQWLALWWWGVFLAASLASLGRVFRAHPWALLFSSLALCLWPSGIVHSVRIGNDLPLYALYALGFYATLRWWHSGRSRWLFWAGVWAMGALLTKSNALALWGVIGALWLARHSHALAQGRWFQNRRRMGTQALVLALCFSLALVANLGDNLWYYLNGESQDWLLSNVSDVINPRLGVENRASAYLVFDLATFIEQPFINAWDDEYGRQYFWNYLFRSSLSSEFFFHGAALESWGRVNGVLLLLMLAGQVYFVINRQLLLGRAQKVRSLYRHLPWVLAVVFPLLLLLAYRIKVPLSCNTDFRYVYMMLVPLLFVSMMSFAREGHGLGAARLGALAAPAIGAASLWWLYWLV